MGERALAHCDTTRDLHGTWVRNRAVAIHNTRWVPTGAQTGVPSLDMDRPSPPPPSSPDQTFGVAENDIYKRKFLWGHFWDIPFGSQTPPPPVLSSNTSLAEAHCPVCFPCTPMAVRTGDLKMSGNGKGPLSIEVPTQKELLVTTDGIGLQRLEAAVSPVFMSVGPDGKLQRGCGGVDWGKGPILIVSNHQVCIDPPQGAQSCVCCMHVVIYCVCVRAKVLTT